MTSSEANIKSITHLTLYVAGNEPNSRIALQNLREICSGTLEKHCVIEVIDVYHDFEKALQERIVVPPTLVVVTENPATKAVFFGSLHDKNILLKYLKKEPSTNE